MIAMNIIIEPATKDNLQAIDSVQRAAFIQELWEPTSLFQNIINHGPDFCFIAMAEDRSQCAGYVLSYPTDRTRTDFEDGPTALQSAPNCLYLHDLCVSPDFRGMRIAKQLLQKLEEQTKAHKLPAIIGLSVQDSAAFWEKCGFIAGASCRYHGEPAIKIRKTIEL